MKLYIISTPIGNLGDMTYRAVETLKEVDFIAAEDTRVSSKLLNYFDIKKPMISYYEHNKRAKGEEIVSRILAGESCGLVTDAGTPAISDPGEDIVALCHEKGVEVVPVVGASAVIAALSVSGQPTGRFTFEGFLSTNKKSRFEHLESLKNETRTMVFYEAPHKLKKTLADMQKYFGNRPLTICREITKKFEEYINTNLDDAVELYNQKDPRGEYVLVIKGADISEADVSENTEQDSLDKVRELINSGMTLKDAVKFVSASMKIPKNTLYNLALNQLKGEE
ncbi:MAG: 16S rRNA (cytidine(1402)-2'-O)-methyltransferase [Clostridia bacterium]